jgi:hypothetical protein
MHNWLHSCLHSCRHNARVKEIDTLYGNHSLDQFANSLDVP